MAIKPTQTTLISVGETRTNSAAPVTASRVLKTSSSSSRSVSTDNKTKVVTPVNVISGTPVSYPVQIPAKVIPAVIDAAPKSTISAINDRIRKEMANPEPYTPKQYIQGATTNRAINIDPPSADKKFGDTTVGKILKGAAIAGGSILGLGGVIGGITGSATGTGVLAGAVGGVSKIVKTVGGGLDKVGTAAVNILTGTTKEERDQVKEVKAEARAAAEQLEQVDRLVKAGATPEQARGMAGVPEAEMMSYNGQTIQSAGFDYKILLYIGGALAALFLLPKLFKMKR